MAGSCYQPRVFRFATAERYCALRGSPVLDHMGSEGNGSSGRRAFCFDASCVRVDVRREFCCHIPEAGIVHQPRLMNQVTNQTLGAMKAILVGRPHRRQSSLAAKAVSGLSRAK